MVATKHSYTVVPSEPTPNDPLFLSECDQSRPWSLSPTIYVYPSHNTSLFSFSHIVETLKVSLGRVLVPFYPLAGRLRWIGGGRLEVDCNAMGAEFVVAESDSTLQEFGDFDPTDKLKPLLPKIDYGLPIEKLPAMSVLVTRFACGGITLGLAISHSLMDGTAAMQFIKSWTKLARGEALDESDMPFHDRSVMVCGKDVNSDTPAEFKPLPLLNGRSDTAEEQGKETKVAMLKLTKEQSQALKNRTNSGVEEGSRPYSTFEAISAHVWRSACKARGHDYDQPTVHMVGVDIRKRVNPPLPNGYCGNAIVRTITDPNCVSGELVSKPLSYAAGKIRESVYKVTGSYVESTLGFIKSQEDVSWMRSSFHAAEIKQAQFLGNPTVFMTSWMRMKTHDADFGWGNPSYMGMGALSCDGKCFIIPDCGCDEDGSLVVAMRLQTAHMALFEQYFYRDI